MTEVQTAETRTAEVEQLREGLAAMGAVLDAGLEIFSIMRAPAPSTLLAWREDACRVLARWKRSR